MQVRVMQQRSNPSAAPAQVAAIEQAFELFIDQPSFPCLGANASQSRQQMQLLRAGDITGNRHDAEITHHLQALVESTRGRMFISVAVIFLQSPALDEAAFEAVLWERLRAIHTIDRVSYAWDPRVSNDAASPRFSMSVGCKAFYVVGLHPGASRPARRFVCPALVFNLHSQFEQLRADGRYGKLREAILERDLAYAGSANPMLDVHGKGSQARQYSGREVGSGWVCPFHFSGKDGNA